MGMRSAAPGAASGTLRLYRLATATRPARQVCMEPAVRAGQWHEAGDRVLYGYESEELAALSLSHLTLGVEPARLVHERIELPADPWLHAEFNVAEDPRARRAMASHGTALPLVNLCEVLRERNLLAVWVRSPYVTRQRTVLIHVDHPDFERVRIRSHVMPGEQFFAHGPCSAEPDDAWAPTQILRHAAGPHGMRP
ncbi:MAG: hypothetical protein J0H69_10485 [Burkholderiales bacterium]|nr:hypothetical protein [Burkholderiales bacterium]